MFLNKQGRESGAHKLPKMSVFGLKIRLFQRKKKKSQFSVSTILNIGRSILDTLRYCEKFRDLGFRSILDTIFSRLFMSKPQLPNLQQTVANTILSINISNKSWVGILTPQGHINQVYQGLRSQLVSQWSELQKRTDHADQSVLFFLAGANFWEKHAKNC